jgi:hypothetical protein
MQTRLETLQRLVTLYAVVEEMHSTELQRMASAVRQAQRAIGVEQEVARSARMDARGALLSEERMDWMSAQTRHEAAAGRRRGLERVRLEREDLNEAAREQYVASRLKREQIKRVFDDIAARLDIEKERRSQAASDDRFLARRRWTDSQEKKRETTSG